MKKALLASLLFVLPGVAFAQSNPNLGPLTSLVQAVGNIFGLLVPILMILAMVVFFWGLVTYIWGAGGGEGHEKGRKIMIAGLTSLFVMVCVWGIVIFAANALGVNYNQGAITPGLPR